MQSFEFFHFYDYAIIVGLMAITGVYIQITHKRIRKHMTEKLMKINLLVGISISVLATIMYRHIEISHGQLLAIFQPVSQMTSIPVVLFSIAVLLVGLSLTIIGLDKHIVVSRQVISDKT